MAAPCLAVHAKSPPLSIVRRFIHLLEQSQQDFWEESEVLRLQEEVVKRIRASQQLESDLNLMDIKIGLLVKNRITLQVGSVAAGEGPWPPYVALLQCSSCVASTELVLPSLASQLVLLSALLLKRLKGLGSIEVPLAPFPPSLLAVTNTSLSLPAWLQEVVSHCKKLTKKNKEQLLEMMSIDKQKGLKSLSKEKRQKLEAYQHLFYLLQVGLVRACCVHCSWGSSAGTLAPCHPMTLGVSLVFLFPADPACVLGQADLPDATEQVH